MGHKVSKLQEERLVRKYKMYRAGGSQVTSVAFALIAFPGQKGFEHTANTNTTRQYQMNDRGVRSVLLVATSMPTGLRKAFLAHLLNLKCLHPLVPVSSVFLGTYTPTAIVPSLVTMPLLSPR